MELTLLYAEEVVWEERLLGKAVKERDCLKRLLDTFQFPVESLKVKKQSAPLAEMVSLSLD